MAPTTKSTYAWLVELATDAKRHALQPMIQFRIGASHYFSRERKSGQIIFAGRSLDLK